MSAEAAPQARDVVHSIQESMWSRFVHFFNRFLLKPLLLVAASVAIWRIIWLVCQSRPQIGGASMFAERVLLPSFTLFLVLIIMLRHEMHWAKPARKLCELLPQIRSGQCPIEELSHVGGPDDIGQLIPELQELFRDLRRQKVELSILNEEMRQKVAQRTDALERAMGSLRTQATRDALTGLGNRRMMDITLPQLFESCRTERLEMCVLMMDVDNFKKLNDTLGHPMGDQLLRDIGQLIRSSIRQSDTAFRLGGDEFVVLMPGAAEEAAKALQNRLTSLVDAHAKTLRVEPRPGLSIGLARLSDCASDASFDALLKLADEKLYEVKKTRKSAAVESSPALRIAPAAANQPASVPVSRSA